MLRCAASGTTRPSHSDAPGRETDGLDFTGRHGQPRLRTKEPHMSNPLAERLDAGIVLGDSAMGTMLFDFGHATDSCLDELNLTNPQQVAQIHRANINAGADFIETNTFGANRYRLEQHGLADKVRDINFRAVKIAREEREISGRPVLIAGSIGPTGRWLEPVGTLPIEDAFLAFREQVE